MSAYHVSGKGLVFVINKQVLQTTIKRQANETGKGFEQTVLKRLFCNSLSTMRMTYSLKAKE